MIRANAAILPAMRDASKYGEAGRSQRRRPWHWFEAGNLDESILLAWRGSQFLIAKFPDFARAGLCALREMKRVGCAAVSNRSGIVLYLKQAVGGG